MPEFVNITGGQLDQLKALATRAHDGTVTIRGVESGGLPWLEVSVLLTDMGDVAPLHTFLLSPRGSLKDAGYVQQGAASPREPT
jgi:hypothetical protein